MKFCRNCGMKLEDDDNWCRKCGANQNKENLPPVDFNNSNMYNNYFYKKYNVTCIIGFILGLVSIFFKLWGIIPIVGLICSNAGLRYYDKQMEKGYVLGVIGYILNSICLLWIFILILLVILGFNYF